MAKLLDSKCKQCRREGLKLYLKGERCLSPKCAVVKRNYPPGMHGPKGRSKLTGFGVQLREKQKAKRYYGVLERQFRLYFERVAQKKGNTAELLLQVLESRLDNVVVRLGFATSRAQGRELVSHGHFTVNGKKVNVPSYQVKPEDVLEVSEASKKLKYFQDMMPRLEKLELPEWLSLDAKQLKGRFLSRPTVAQISPLFDLKYIVEFYSR